MAIGNFSIPARISFGLGAVAALQDLREQFAPGRALLVCDGALPGTPTLQRVIRFAGPHVLFAGAASLPAQNEVLDGAELYVTEECQAIIAIGGAAAMELAKAIRLKVTHPLSLGDYDSSLGGAGRITADLPPLLAVPTLPGAASAVSPSLLVQLERTARLVLIASPYLTPTAVVQDPELSLDTPLEALRQAALGALAQNVDSYLSPGFHPIADAAALEGARLTFTSLPQLAAHPWDLQALSNSIWGAILSAMAASKGPGVTQAIAHRLHNRYAVPYAIARLLLAAAGMHTQDPNARQRIEILERNCGVGDLADALRAAVSPKTRLRDWHVPESGIDLIATASTSDPVNCYPFEPGEVAALLRAAW